MVLRMVEGDCGPQDGRLLKVVRGGVCEPQAGRRRSLWVSGQQEEEELMGFRVAEGGAYGLQDGKGHYWGSEW